MERHDAYLPVNSIQHGGQAWRLVANDYNRIANGLFSHKDANQLNSKWRNILYHARKFGYPHPLESQNNGITEAELIQRVKTFKFGPEADKSEIVTDLNSRQNALTLQTVNNKADSLPPKEGIKTKGVIKRTNTRSNRDGNRLANVSIPKKKSMVALELQQEKLRMLRETHQLKYKRLLVDLERAELELEKGKNELAISKYEANKRGLLV